MRLLFCLFLVISLGAAANDSTRLYNPSANAAADVAQLLRKAKAENRRVLLQIGGNWCVMCYRLNAFIQTDAVLKKLMEASFIVYHLNYSRENKNEAYLKKLGLPQRFGFPVLVVLDSGGNRLQTQETGALQRGNGYDVEKVKAFLLKWAGNEALKTGNE